MAELLHCPYLVEVKTVPLLLVNVQLRLLFEFDPIRQLNPLAIQELVDAFYKLQPRLDKALPLGLHIDHHLSIADDLLTQLYHDVDRLLRQ